MSSTQDFTCIFCSKTFEDKESLQEHFRKHGDPKFNNVTKNKSRFENEQSMGSEKSEDNELVGCDVCDETFKSISKAITHKHKVHPDHDAKYFCPWCGKLFTMKHLYNKHMQSNHVGATKTDETVYHCDSCNVDFYLPSAMLYHNKFFHRQDTELPAIGHSKKVMTCNQEMLQIYYCPFCGEEYNNKVNLHKHMADDHSDENQSPEEVLRCPLCEAVFYHLDAYELHLSFHSSEDVYSDDNEMAAGITDFSLESVPPIVEKVEEETKNVENEEGIDKFLQLIMHESRDSGNNDGLDKKSKKHKKHKKSKKAAITLDEFLNMNKDVFGDGLDIQGIEEVPTQQVLKKIKGKKDNTAKVIPASALAKLKKQGITVKSNSGPNSPTFKTNKNVIINRATSIVPNRIPVMATEKPKAVATSNELLSKLLNQGNSQIKIVKKCSPENINKEKLCNQVEAQEPISSSSELNSNKELSSHTSETEVTNGNNNHEMVQDTNEVEANDSLDAKNTTNHSDYSTEPDKEDNRNLLLQEPIATTSNSIDSIRAKTFNHANNDLQARKTETSKANSEVPDNLQEKEHQAEMHINDNNDNMDPNEEDNDTNASDEDDVPSPTQNKFTKSFSETFQQENLEKPNKPLDALKHLSGHITIKPTQNAESKNDIIEPYKLNENNETDEEDNNKQFNFPRNLGKNIILKKPNIPQKKLDAQTKPTDALKTLNKQLTITPCVTSTTKCNDESEDDELDSHITHETMNISNKNITNEKDYANFKTPMLLTKQMNATSKPNDLLDDKPLHLKNTSDACRKEEDNAKHSFNMDILKRLTNVTAKPISRPTNIPQTNKSQPSDSRSPVVNKIEKNKKIDQDIEIFNIDDSDSDHEFPDEESVLNQIINPTNSDRKTIASPNVLKNLNKNITIKSTNVQNKNKFNIKREVHSDNLKQIPDDDVPNSINNESKNMSQKKPLNIHLNDALKKLGNNISIKPQYSSPESHKYETPHEEDIDDDFDTNEEGSDSENPGQVKITEMQEDDEDPHSDIDMEYNDNAIVQSPHASNSENEEETHNSQSDDDTNDDIEKQIKSNTVSKENSVSKCLDNFKRNNRQLTIKSLNDKNTFIAPNALPRKKQEEAMRVTNKVCKDMSVKQFRAAERQDDDTEALTKNMNQSASTSSSSQKVSNQVNTVKTVKTFQSETIIEEITTTVTKTIRTVNQSSKQVAKKPNAVVQRPRIVVANQQTKPLQGMTVRNSPTVGTKIRNAAPSPRPSTAVPSKAVGQLVPVRPQNQIMARPQGIIRPSIPGPSNIRKMSPQSNVQKPVIGKPLKISPLAMNQTIKRASENVTGNFGCFKRPKDSMIPSMDSFDDDNDDSMVNYSSSSSCRSDFSTSATKIVKGKSVVTATQARSEQHSEQHITKLNNMAGLKVVRTSAKQASQVETKTNNMCAAKRTTMDAIEKLQKQGLLIKKPRIEEPEEDDFHSGSEGGEEDYEEND